jgi:hypothetical protein
MTLTVPPTPYAVRGPCAAQDARQVFQVVRQLLAFDGTVSAALPVAECLTHASAAAHAAALNAASAAWAQRPAA